MKNLKLALLGATFLVGASALSSANAADVYSRGGGLKDTGPVDYVPATSWTGIYFGVHAGGTFSDTSSFSFDNPNVVGADFDNDGVGLAGLHLGYNWQTAGNLVLGIEGSVSFPLDSDDFGADVLGTIRGRIGYAAGRTLLYATGGVAFANASEGNDSDTETGWVAGLGVEHKIRNNVSLGLEALYYSFDEDFDGFINQAGQNLGSGEIERDFWTIQARLTYHLGDDRHSEALK